MREEEYVPTPEEVTPDPGDPWVVTPEEMLACLPDPDDDDPWPEEDYDFS